MTWLLNLFEALLKAFTPPSPLPEPPQPLIVPPEPPKPVEPTPMPPVETNAGKVCKAVLAYLGKDLSTVVDNEIACAESVSRIIQKVYPTFPLIVGTAALHQHMKTDPCFKASLTAKAGNIVISPSGMGKVPHGHTGIMLDEQNIASNSSFTGKFDKNYTLTSWVKYFRTANGFPVFFWAPVDTA